MAASRISSITVTIQHLSQLILVEDLMAKAAADSTETRRLLDQAQSGEDRAREQLFARHQRYLHAFVVLRIDPKLRARVDPSDVVQDAQIEALRRLDSYLRQRPM